MSSRDRLMTAVVLTLDAAYAERMPEALDMLKGVDFHVETADDDNSVVEGTLPADRLPDLKQLPCVEYVRQEMTWVADYPEGDPRDRPDPHPGEPAETRDYRPWSSGHPQPWKRYP